MDLMVSSDATVSTPVGPFEGLGAFVVDSDIASDFAGEVGFGSKDAAGDQISLNFGEPDFDLIEPGRVSRRVMELNVGMGGEELSHGLGLVRRKVVSDDVDLLASGLRGDHICEKGNELRTGVALGCFAQDLSAGNLQCGVERQSAMPEILKAVALGTTGRKGQNRIQPIESLNGALFIHAEHCRVGRRLEIEADNVGRLGLEGRIVAGHVMTPPGRLQTGLGPYTSDPHVTDVQLGGELARTPMSGTVGGLVMQGPINDPGFQAFGARSHRLAQMASPETGDAFLQKAVSPEFDGIDATRLAATDRGQSAPARQTEDYPSSSHIIGSAALAAAYTLQLTSFRRAQSKGCRIKKTIHQYRQMSLLQCTSKALYRRFGASSCNRRAHRATNLDTTNTCSFVIRALCISPNSRTHAIAKRCSFQWQH
jgi:hypothetical protein